MWNLKYDTNELIYKTFLQNLFTKQAHRHRKQIYGYQKGKKVGDKLGVWDQQIQTAISKTDKQQGTTVQHRELYSVSCNKP